MTTLTARQVVAANAVAKLGHTKMGVAAAFGTSPRTLGRWMEKLEAETRANKMAELDAQFEGKVSRRNRHVVTNCQRTGTAASRYASRHAR